MILLAVVTAIMAAFVTWLICDIHCDRVLWDAKTVAFEDTLNHLARQREILDVAKNTLAALQDSNEALSRMTAERDEALAALEALRANSERNQNA